MKTLLNSLLAVLTFQTIAEAAPGTELADYAGVYECSQLLRTAPTLKQLNRVRVDVKILSGDRVWLLWNEPGFSGASYISGAMGNGIVQGDYEYRNSNPVEMLALQDAATGHYLVFSFNKPNDAAVATSCPKIQ